MASFKENWPRYRLKQLDELRSLLNEASTVNKGTNIIERLQKIEKLSERLLETRRNLRQTSFYHFLEDLAITRIEEDING